MRRKNNGPTLKKKNGPTILNIYNSKNIEIIPALYFSKISQIERRE